MLPTAAQLADEIAVLRKEVSELKGLVEILVMKEHRAQTYGPVPGTFPMTGRPLDFVPNWAKDAATDALVTLIKAKQ